MKLSRSLSLLLVSCSLAAGVAACSADASQNAVAPADDEELRAKDGKIETFDAGGGRFGVALASRGERLLVLNETFGDRASAEAGALSLVAHGSTEYAYFARQLVNGDWIVDLMNNGKAVASTPPAKSESSGKRSASLARATLRFVAWPAAVSRALGMTRFELTTASDGQRHFRLLDKGGKALLVSEAYRQTSSALKGIDSVRLYGGSGDDATYQLTDDGGGKVKLSLMAYNGELVAHGLTYASRAEAEQARADIRALIDAGVPTVEK